MNWTSICVTFLAALGGRDILREEKRATRELAYYHPHPVWRQGDWLKNLILFFDGIAVLLPRSGRDKPFERDPEIAIGLHEHGLLEILEADSFIDQEAMEAMATELSNIIDSGAFDQLDRDAEFNSLSYSRLGGMADPVLAEYLVEELVQRQLARPMQDDQIWMHGQVRLLILLLWSQILRSTGAKRGLSLEPVTDNPQVLAALRPLLGVVNGAGVGHVVDSDLQAVSVDVSSFPIDEIAQFRQENKILFLKYALELRTYVGAISSLGEEERVMEMARRKRDLAELAQEIREISKKAWKKSTLRVGLKCLGSSVPGPWGGLTELAKAPADPRSGTAYEYLLRAAESFN